MTLLAIILSAILYRIPRGGPGRDWWEHHFGFGFGSLWGTAAWAGGSALLIGWASGAPLWAWAALAAWLCIADRAMPYMRWVSDDGVNVPALTLRGLLYGNPLMGVIYEGARRNRDRLPRFGAVIDGFTAWAELACGLVVAIVWCGVLSLI